MEKTVFISFDEYVVLVNRLKEETGLELYLSEGYDMPFTRIDHISALDYELINLSLELSVLMGGAKDFLFTGKPQGKVFREDKIGFVNVTYGRDDDKAIGATIFNGDKSEAEKLIDRVLTKLLKIQAHRGVVSSEGSGGGLWDKYYWTDGALASGKNWHLFLGTGVRKIRNSSPGYAPKSSF
ncbi:MULTISPECIES: hypothetical protein [Pseudomonas]|jgi:hypothetical protein|uniref:hypothetical protein n=1 Tax=Pseudomonas TaxID=286 RepID=UPI0011C02B68